MKPKISIIVATYNSGKTLNEALESVLNQDFQDWECIIVDGASKDQTLEIVEKYEKLDARFRHISEPDKGIYDAFNKGWKLANGEWVHYLGSDDKLTKNSFTELLKEDHEEADVISGTCYLIKLDGEIVLQKAPGWDGSHQAKITRRVAIERMNGFDERYRIIADYDLLMRLKSSGSINVNVDSPVAYFNTGGVSQSLKNNWVIFKEKISIDRNNGIPIGVKQLLYFSRQIGSMCYRKLNRRIKRLLKK